MKINILGTEYTVNFYDYGEKPIFAKSNICGYHCGATREIGIGRLITFPGFEIETAEYCRNEEKVILRHEIVHAFLHESGLADSSLQYTGAWAKNEEMVDWIAAQFPKMQRAFMDADCL